MNENYKRVSLSFRCPSGRTRPRRTERAAQQNPVSFSRVGNSRFFLEDGCPLKAGSSDGFHGWERNSFPQEHRLSFLDSRQNEFFVEKEGKGEAFDNEGTIPGERETGRLFPQVPFGRLRLAEGLRSTSRVVPGGADNPGFLQESRFFRQKAKDQGPPEKAL